MNKRIPFVYLISTSYSGSTLLSILMNAHPQVASVGELANSIGMMVKGGSIDRYYCSCGLEIKQCAFWKNVKRYCFESGVELDLHNFNTNLDAGFGEHLNRLLFGKAKRFESLESLRDSLLWMLPGFRNMIKDTIHLNIVVAQAILRASEKEILFDASKDAKRGFYLAKDNICDFKLVHLVRDITGFINSCRKRKGDGYYEKASNNWIRVHQAALRMKADLPDKAYLLVKYERLCEHTEETIEEICRFIGIDAIDLVARAKKNEHHIIGNTMRARPFNAVCIDEAWKKDLSDQQIAACMQKTGYLRKLLDYK